MADDISTEIYKSLRAAQEKYDYFLLAASGAAIGFAMTQTRTASISWSQIPLGFAVVCWGLSFFFGCRHLQYVASSLYANFELTKVQNGSNPLSGTDPQRIQAASEGIRKAIQSNSDRSNCLARLQFRLLVAGAICYIAWHILGMSLRAVC
ncbi:MAG: hypothetical protein WAO19_07865 [Candidatus Kryptoniota bacterium]